LLKSDRDSRIAFLALFSRAFYYDPFPSGGSMIAAHRTLACWLALVACGTATVGCASVGSNSDFRHQLTKEPDAAFMKRVSNDPFPAASEQGLVSGAGGKRTK